MNFSKCVATLAVAVMVSFVSFGQEKEIQPSDNQTKTLFSRSSFKFSKLRYIGVYVAPTFQYGQVDGSFEPMVGGSVSVLFNKRFSIGVAGYGTAPTRRFSNDLRLAYGGGKLEYTFFPNQVVHFSVPLLIGGGFASNSNDFDFGGRGRNGSSFFVVQPGLTAEVNLLRYLKLFGGANYRVAMGVDNHNTTTTFTNAQLSGFTAEIGVKAGIFDASIRRKRERVPLQFK
ncbi:MAG: hypothetical protein U0Y10_05020 [Spirosomataceae bacterium]